MFAHSFWGSRIPGIFAILGKVPELPVWGRNHLHKGLLGNDVRRQQEHMENENREHNVRSGWELGVISQKRKIYRYLF